MATLALWAPPPDLTVSEWADAERRLSSESSAEPGRYSAARAEYQRGIQDAFSDSTVETVAVMSSAQIGKTTIVENVSGYHIDQDPSPILLLQPTIEMAETFSKDRLAPMLRDTPVLRGKVKDVRSRDSGNTMLHKQFPGGHITMAGANSAASLASRPVRIVLCDEIDRYPVSAGTEGDPVNLARKRTTAFWNRKIGLFSTPTVAGSSRIEKAYEDSDKRRWHVPCPECLQFQILRWERVKWENSDPLSARYHCDHCAAKWDDNARWRSVSRGEWRATAEFRGVAGFHLNEICSTWVKLSEMVRGWMEAQASPELLKVWVNTSLGETWQERGDAPDWEKIKARSVDADYRLGEIHAGVLLLTAGVDVQKDRIEAYTWGWGRGKRSWLIDFRVIHGDTSRPEVWAELDQFMAATYRYPSGPILGLSHVCIDSGHATTEVYAWARRHSAQRLSVVKGETSGVALVGLPSSADIRGDGKRARRGVRVWPINVSMAKAELYGWLHLETPESGAFPPGWVSVPLMDDEFYKQLTAEQFVTRIVKGYRKGEWIKTRERNEALDCRNYARGAAYRHGMDRWTEDQWTLLETQFPSIAAATVQRAPEPKPQASQGQDIQPQRRDSWLGNRGGWLK